MKEKVLFLISILMISPCSSGWAQTPLEFPEKPLRLIAESAKDSCSVLPGKRGRRLSSCSRSSFPQEECSRRPAPAGLCGLP